MWPGKNVIGEADLWVTRVTCVTLVTLNFCRRPSLGLSSSHGDALRGHEGVTSRCMPTHADPLGSGHLHSVDRISSFNHRHRYAHISSSQKLDNE